MSMNHICKNGLSDIDLAVKDIECTTINSTTINATTINVEGAPIQSFDQDLNTTDDVRFNQIRLTSTMFTDPDQCVSKQYVDNSAPGLGSLQTAYNGGNTIVTAPGFPIELTGTEGLNLNSNPITTGKLTFPNSQELISRQYVDDAIANIPQPPATTLQDAYDFGNGQITLSTSKPLEIIGNEGINVNANSVTTTKLTFNNPQEFATVQYVNDTATSQPNQSITWAIQGILNDYNTSTSSVILPLSNVVDGSLSINYPGVGDFRELNTNIRTANLITIPIDAWYSLRAIYSHPPLPILGTNSQQGLGSDCRLFLKINGGNLLPFAQEDSGAGVTESVCATIDRYFTAGTTVEIHWIFGSAQINEDFFINISLINMTKSISLSNFSGATLLANGTQGLVPAPQAGQIYHNLMSDGNWLRVAAPEYVRNYGSVILDWQSYDNPSTKNINVAGNSFYSTSDNNNFYISLINGGSQTGYVNFDAGQQFSKFQFTVSYRIPITTQPADTLSFFVNGTQVDSGGENQTSGNCFVTDYYSNSSFIMKSKFIKDDGTDLTSFQTDGYLPVTDHYNIMTITGFDNNLSIEIKGDSGRYFRTGQFPTNGQGTRFGIHGRTGSSLMEVQINSMQLIAL